MFRARGYPVGHPLAIERVGLVMELVEGLGWLAPDLYAVCPTATEAELARFHDPAYIAAVRRAQEAKGVALADRERYRLGTLENPYFATMYERAATACGGSIAAARAVAGGGIAFNPAGGTHHARRDAASGFCYFNDPVLAIATLLDLGLAPVFYADIDGHHGDGVQDAFAGDPRVMTVSVHEAGRWPQIPGSMTGALDDRGGGNARNLPVPAGFNDTEMDFVIEHAFVGLAERLAPEAVVVTCGADALAEDPLTLLALSNGALWRAVRRLVALAPRAVVVGGGGYNPWSAARCWAGLWGTLAGYPMPGRLPSALEARLRAVRWDFDPEAQGGDAPRPEAWFTTLADAPRPGPVREVVRQTVAAVLAP